VQELYDLSLTQTDDNTKSQIIEKLNELDAQITTYMLTSEKSTCCLKDRVLWSPEIEQANFVCQYWCVVYRARRQHIDATKRIDNIWEKLNTESKKLIIDNTISINQALKQSLQRHSELCKDHQNLRDIHLQRKVDDFNARDDTTEVLNIEKLMRRERKRQDHAFIRNILKDNRSKGITVLEVPSPTTPGTFITITDPDVIRKYLLIRNVNHFGQANNTPFCTAPLLDFFEYEGINAETEKLILEGIIPLEIQGQPPHVNMLLEHLADTNNLPTINQDITFEEFFTGMRKWNERTTTSPSGRHLGHYKVLIRLKVMDETQTINLSMEILNLYYMVCMTAVNIGRSLERWGNISTCMLEKVVGVPRIDKLRVIHLFEADFNMHDRKVINDGQAGSRPNKRAIDVVIQKEMKYLYAMTTRTELGTIDNDAKSCYDRMICNFSMAVSYYYGVPKNYCSMLANNLKQSKYSIRTGLGDSSEKYQHTVDTPIHGTGQGSCASPALWLMTSSWKNMDME
jgi:hypothetical protein